MLKDRVCPHCNEEFKSIEGRIFSNHVKWCSKNPKVPTNIKCTLCGETVSSNSLSVHNCIKRKKICLFCEKEFVGDDLRNKFCSSSCCAKFYNKVRKDSNYISPLKGYVYDTISISCVKCGNPFNTKENIQHLNICDTCRNVEIKNGRKCIMVNGVCQICGNQLTYAKHQKVKKTCSPECYKNLMSSNAKNNINCGGETNYKRYIYKGILMDSSWEVEIAKLMDELNIEWKRDKKIVLWWFDENNKKRRYHPDFYIPTYDIYLDTKNKYLMIKDAFKIQKVRENNTINLEVNTIDKIKEFILNLKRRNLGV